MLEEEFKDAPHKLYVDFENVNSGKVINGDCLELMRNIPDKSIDMVLCDLPYGTTACKWDVIIPFTKYIVEKNGKKERYVYQDEYVLKRFKEGVCNYPKVIGEFNSLAKDGLWEQYHRIIKDNGAIVLTASQPFTTDLINSNRKWFKYCWVWDKVRGVGHLNAKKKPMMSTEDICVFYKKPCTYNPQMREREKPKKSKNRGTQEVYGKTQEVFDGEVLDKKYPINLITFSKSSQKDFTLHPTQKPVALFEYLIKTYTNEGDLVLDNCAGSGTTAIACINTNRKFILMEKDENYYEVIKNRINKHYEEN